MPLPDGVETVTVTSGGPLVLPDGTLIQGRIRFTGPDLVTVGGQDLVLGGGVTAYLSAGAFSVELVATDVAGMDPTGWTYTVTSLFTNAPNWIRYVSLPKATPEVALADVLVPDPVTGAYAVLLDEGTADARYLSKTGGTITGTLDMGGRAYFNTAGALSWEALPKGVTGRSENAGLALGSSYAGGDDDGTGTDSTGRMNLYSYQRANVGSFGETVRSFLMRKDAKAMTAWYGPQSGTAANYDGNRDPAAGSSWKPWTWTGAHYEANDHGSIHGHWEVEVPDSTGALQGRLEIPFVDQENSPGTIGVDVTNIRTNLADFSVRASNGQVLRVGAANQYNKDIVLSISSDRATTARRWAVRATSETEAGANAGTNFQLVRYDDTGNFLDSPIGVNRATGNVTLGPGLIARRASPTVSSVSLNSTSLGAGVGVIGIGNAATVPTTNPTGGGVLYAEGGALKWRGPSGAVTTIGLA